HTIPVIGPVCWITGVERTSNSVVRPRRRMTCTAKILACVAVLACAGFAREAPPPRDEEGRAADNLVEKKSRALLAEWKERFDAEQFSYVVAGPFVIAGDGTAKQLAQYRDATVLAAERALRKTYFDKAPTDP